MERQIAQEGQIDTRGTGEVVIDRFGVLIHFVREPHEGERHIGSDRQVELGLAEGGDNHCPVTHAAGNLKPAHAEFHVQAFDRQRLFIRILNVELDRKILLQQIAAAHFNAHDRDVWAGELGRHEGTGAKTQQTGGSHGLLQNAVVRPHDAIV